MIDIKFSRNKSLSTIKLTIKGHAGAADKGNDLICSAVSFAAYCISKNISDLYEVGAFKKEPKIELEEGNAVIACTPTAQAYRDVYMIYLVMQTGLELYAQRFPEYIKVTSFVSGSTASK